MPPWAHLVFSLLEIPIGITAIFLAFGVAKGNNTYRIVLLRFLPILFISSAIDFYSGFIGPDTPQRNEALVGAIIALALTGLIYAAFYWFYKKDAVVNSVFIKALAT